MTKTIETTKSVPTYQEVMKLSNTSERIRFLTKAGLGRKDIVNMLNVRYQHVRNVQITPVRKA